jgi:hypothetical protein
MLYQKEARGNHELCMCRLSFFERTGMYCAYFIDKEGGYMPGPGTKLTVQAYLHSC